MASKDLIEKVENIVLEAMLHGAHPHNVAEAAIATILAALQEPTEGMNVAGCQADDPLGALIDWRGENCTPREGVANVWRAMLAASALGEQSE